MSLSRYEPSALLAWAYPRLFDRIAIDDAWASQVREAQRLGTVVYVLRNLSFVDFFALDYLTRKLSLPEVRFANDLGVWMLEPVGTGLLHALRRSREAPEMDLERVLSSGSSAALFLKRPAHLFEAKARGKTEGNPYIRALFKAQRHMDKPIMVVPQVFVWTKHPDAAAKPSLIDGLLGPREWPGQIRSMAQFAANYGHVTLRAGEPVDVRAFLAQNEDEGSDEVLVRRFTYTLLRKLERERRTVVGPARKPADRVRQEVLRSPKLQKVISDLAGNGVEERRVLTAKADDILKEMEATLDMDAISAMEKAVSQVTSRMYEGIEVDKDGLERLRNVSKDGTLVFLPSHKSHIDYVILAYALFRASLPLPLIAAGDNLNFFPLGALFRRAGAFFIRRSFQGDRLYAAVIDAYLRRVVKDGLPLEFFLEGGRSRTGKLLPPKLGLLSIVVDASIGASKPVYFCPISIGYERFVEERSFVFELTGGDKRKEDLRGLLSAVAIAAGHYGRISVEFGDFLTIDDVMKDIDPGSKKSDLLRITPAKRRAVVTRLAYRVMNEINRVTAVTPGALVATALLTHEARGMPHADLVLACERLARTLRGMKARFASSLEGTAETGKIKPTAIREALELFVRAGHVKAHCPGAPVGSSERTHLGDDAIYVVPDQDRLSLDLAKNMLMHFFVSRAMIASCFFAQGTPTVARDVLCERVQALSRLFKYEFMFRADAPFETIFNDELTSMATAGEIALEGDEVRVADEAAMRLYAGVVRSFIEGYRVAARGLTVLLRGPVSQKDVVKRAITTGEQMFLAGELLRREAISRPVLENACTAFVDQGYLGREQGKYVLPDSYDSAETVKTIEAKIVGFLPRVLTST